MEELRNLFRQTLNGELIQMTLSGTTDVGRAEKIKVRPVLMKDELMFQETLYRNNQVFHKNLKSEEMAVRLAEYMDGLFRQA